MKNIDIIKSMDTEQMALTIMCPYEAGLIEKYRCASGDKTKNCRKCAYEWLNEEDGD